MPCHTKMKLFPQGLFGLTLLLFNCLVVLSLEPGYLDFDNLPDTNFTCVGKVIGGYYADLETNCQMFHVCTIGQLDEPMDIRFLCLNGTVFDQETRVCERIDEVDCSKSEQFYSLNLELYGNTQPPILEEDSSEDNEKSYSTPSSTASSTTKRSSISKPTILPYYTTTSSPTSTLRVENVITSHHFPVANNPDIRFNPEEINVSLNADAPPDIIRSEVPISFQHQSFSNSESNTKVTITTHTNYKNDEPHHISLSTKNSSSNYDPIEEDLDDDYKLSQTVLTPKSIVSYGLTHNDRNRYKTQHATPKEVNYGFNYHHTNNNHQDLLEGSPTHPFYYQLSKRNNYSSNSVQSHPYQTTTTRQPKHQFSTKSPQSEKYSQLPLPLFPTLSPLSFSSPSPFSAAHHSESKRFTQDHHAPPRVVISASASVSDNNGRRLNYSLGTIGASHLLGPSPPSYDDYKEEDVILDPFFHDVPKIKSLRHKRSALKKEDFINNDEDAADLLKFLFQWYKNKEGSSPNGKIPSFLEDIAVINHELAPLNATESEVPDEGHENTTRNATLSDEEDGRFNQEDIIEDQSEIYNDKEVVDTSTPMVTTVQSIAAEDETQIAISKFNSRREISRDNAEPENSIDQNFDYEEELESWSTREPSVENKTETPVFDFANYPDYVNDNYEPLTYQEPSTAYNTENIKRSMVVDETTTNLDYETMDVSSTQENPDSTTNFYISTSDEVPLTTDVPSLSTTIGGDILLQLKTTTDNFEFSTTSPISTSVENLETTSLYSDFTTTTPTTTTKRILKTRPPWYSRKNNPKATKRQRTINIINNKIVTNLNSVLKSNLSEEERQLSEGNNKIKPVNKMLLKPLAELMKKYPPATTTTTPTPLTIENDVSETFITIAPLLKSVIPTKTKYTKIVFSTTPLSKLIRVELRKDIRGRGFSFNCFDKKVHQFYSDPRDCRLFHYCTWGYKRTQMVDMKFVCDFGTYFDEEKLICSKVRPTRCV